MVVKKREKLFKVIGILALIGLLGVMGGGCGGSSSSGGNDTDNPKTDYEIVNVEGAVLPADPNNWTTEEKQAWIQQATLLLDQIASKEFRGRMTGDIGYDRAAYWAAASFKEWGLEPLNGSYFQDYTTSYSMPTESPVISILVNGEVWKSTAKGDYIDDMYVKDVLAAHGTNTGTSRGKVTFLGYGIDATAANTYANSEFEHINSATVYRNDFNEYVGLTWPSGYAADATPVKTDLNVKDRIVIFRNATPNGLSRADYRNSPIMSADIPVAAPEEYKYTVGNDWIRHDEHYIKMGVARQRFAAGALYNQILPNPNIRYQPPVGDNVFQIAMVGSIGRDTSTGKFKETAYTNGVGESKLLNDLFEMQLEIERNSDGKKHTLTDLLARAATVKRPADDNNGAVRSVPMRNFGDGNGEVKDHIQQLYLATQDLFRGSNEVRGAAGGAYDTNYDASIATNSFEFDDSIEIEISTVADTNVNVRGMNVVGVVRGSKYPDEYVIYMSHFDHNGFAGPWMCAGAADNGGGSTSNMIAARYSAMRAAAGDRPERSLVFILDGSEESGMAGAKTAAAWFAANGREKVKAVFHTDSTFNKGIGNITLSATMSTKLGDYKDILFNSDQGRNHPWGVVATGFDAGATITMRAPTTSEGNDNYVGRPRTDVAAWMDQGMPVLVNVSASQPRETTFTSLYHAPYDDRLYVGDHLLALLGIATSYNMFTAAENPQF